MLYPVGKISAAAVRMKSRISRAFRLRRNRWERQPSHVAIGASRQIQSTPATPKPMADHGRCSPCN